MDTVFLNPADRKSSEVLSAERGECFWAKCGFRWKGWQRFPLWRTSLIALVSCALSLSAKESDPLDAVKIYTDVGFLEAGRKEALDLYIPAGAAPSGGFPAVVLVHGGGFVGGNKSDATPSLSSLLLAKRGFVVANINYCLSNPAAPTWPAPVMDCKNAVRFLRKFSAEYGVDPGNISIMGFSAGGQLALLAGMTESNIALEPEAPYPGVSSKVAAIVDFYGGTHFATRRKPNQTGAPTQEHYYDSGRNLLGGKGPEDNPALWELASPVSHVDPKDPPVLIVHGTGDTVVDYLQAEELARTLDGVGVPNKLILLPAVGHSFSLDKPKKASGSVDLTDEVVGFLRNLLRRPEK